jgi:hypothetical protein
MNYNLDREFRSVTFSRWLQTHTLMLVCVTILLAACGGSDAVGEVRELDLPIVRIDGKEANVGSQIHAGSTIESDKSGQVLYVIFASGGACVLGPLSSVKVLPSKDVLVDVLSGSLACNLRGSGAPNVLQAGGAAQITIAGAATGQAANATVLAAPTGATSTQAAGASTDSVFFFLEAAATGVIIEVAQGKVFVKELRNGAQPPLEVQTNQQASFFMGRVPPTPEPAQVDADEKVVFERLKAVPVPDPTRKASPSATGPAGTPTSPTATPSRPSATPPRPSATPPRPTATPPRLP